MARPSIFAEQKCFLFEIINKVKQRASINIIDEPLKIGSVNKRKPDKAVQKTKDMNRTENKQTKEQK